MGRLDRGRRYVAALGTLAALVLLTLTGAEARYAAIVIDAESGKVLHAVNADTRNYPASLTKMMTLYMMFERLEGGALKLDQKLSVSRHASARAPSRLGLQPGEAIAVRDAIGTLVTKSANDAATVVAEAIGSSERRFARMMTAKARELGMARTTFRNASGLPNRHQTSTARDMARLARALLHDFPKYYRYFGIQSYEFAGVEYRNHNHLLGSFAGVDGIKTGYIRASGYNLAASAQRDGRRLIAVVFGGKTARWRDRHVARLLDRGFAAIAEADVGARVVRAALATPPVPDAKPIRPLAAGDSLWVIEVGRYHQFALAHQAITRAADVVPALLRTPVAILSDEGNGGTTVFRPQILGLSESKARRSCDELSRQRIACVAVPSDGVSEEGSR